MKRGFKVADHPRRKGANPSRSLVKISVTNEQLRQRVFKLEYVVSKYMYMQILVMMV